MAGNDRSLPARLAERLLSRSEYKRMQQLTFADAGHGYDAFGANPEWVAMAASLARPFYKYYFRVKSYDSHHIPLEGGAILAANHSGTLPMDGSMLFMDVITQTNPPRLPRPVADFFVPMLPFVAILFSRCGVVAGSRGNVQHLLESGELIMIFPEGVPGIGKAFKDRYQLQSWRVGHCELAIRHGVPIIPVGIVGAEEQMPQIAKLPGIMGAPYIPITLTPFPMPVRYHILYGEPIPVHEMYTPDDADNPKVLKAAAAKVKNAVRELLHRGLHERDGVFV